MDQPIQYVLDFGEFSEKEFLAYVPFTQEQTVLSIGTAVVKITGLTPKDALEKWRNSPEDCELLDTEESSCEIIDSESIVLEINRATIDGDEVE